MYAGLCAVTATQLTICVIAIVKYWEDIYLVLTGKGDIPYDKSLVEDVERIRIKTEIDDLKAMSEHSKKNGLTTEKLDEEIREKEAKYYEFV